MKLKPKFVQRSCVEGNKIDLRQADAVLKYKPDIIIFEMPKGKNGPSTIFNRYSCKNKPFEIVDEKIKKLKIAAKKYPYALSDVVVWENIKKLWKEEVNTQIYNVDSSVFLRGNNLYSEQKYSFAVKKWMFWVYLYLRDFYMAKNTKIVLDNYSKKENLTILICLQSIHWIHTQFLLTNPSKEKIWKYYFGKFKNIKPTKEIEVEIKKKSKILSYYWKKVQKFY